MSSAAVSSGSTLTISLGQTSSFLDVLQGGTLDVLGGGSVISTGVQGSEVLLGGTDSLGVISSGATQTVSANGLAVGVTVVSGGMQTVSSGGTATSTVVNGSQTILSGGTASGGIVSGAFLYSFAEATVIGGQSVSATVGIGGDLFVSGVISVGSSASGSTSSVAATGTATNATIDPGGAIFERVGGTATGTVLATGRTSLGIGASDVIQGGAAFGTMVNSGASQSLQSGSTSGTIVLSGGSQTILSGVALNDVVASGGLVNDSGTLAYVEAPGSIATNAGTVEGGGTLVQSGEGTLIVAGNLTGFHGSALIGGGTLELTEANAVGTATIEFSLGASGTLDIDGEVAPTNVISGFTGRDVIDLAGLGFTGVTTPLVDGSAVTVTEGGVAETLTIAGAANDTFSLTADGGSGTLLVTTFLPPVVSANETLSVSAGQASSFIGVLSGGTLDVLDGGTVVSTTVLGTEMLGGMDSQGIISSGGMQIVSSMGVVVSGTIASGGMQTVALGGQVIGGTIASYGAQTLSSGSTALGATVSVQAIQTVSAGGFASGTVVFGIQSILPGGVVSGSVVDGTTVGNQTTFGDEYISGGQSVSAVIGSNGHMVVSGLISSTASGSGFTSVVLASGSAIDATVSAGGTVDVYLGGTTSGTVLLSGSGGFYGAASESVFTGGAASGTVVNSGTAQGLDGGTTVGTVVLAGGFQEILSGTALNDAVSAGGTVYDAGIVAYTEGDGVTSTFAGTLTASGLLVQSGPGVLDLAGTLNGFTGSAVISGGTLEMASAGAAGSATVSFAANTTGDLRIDGMAGLTNTISGFNAGDFIDLTGLVFAGVGIPTVSGNTVTVTEGSLSESLVIARASFSSFTLRNDGAGGTELQVACYCPGTLILTTRGEVPVALLAIGDTIITASGQHRRIKWIGRRSYAGRFVAANPGVQPIRFRAGSLGSGLPRRDLLVSPEHAMFVDGLLIPARCLVNGSTIAQERGLSQVDYVHVELDTHDVLLAEGAPSETFLDDDSRGMFHNAREFAGLYPDAPEPGRFCAPKVDDGYQLEAIRRSLAAVAAERTRAA